MQASIFGKKGVWEGSFHASTAMCRRKNRCKLSPNTSQRGQGRVEGGRGGKRISFLRPQFPAIGREALLQQSDLSHIFIAETKELEETWEQEETQYFPQQGTNTTHSGGETLLL